MPAGRVKDVHLVVGAAILTVVFGGAAAFISPPGGPGIESSSSFSAAAGGGKAAFLTLKALGYRIERSYEPMASLAVEPSRTTLLVTGTRRASELDRRALRAFLDAGGTALLVGQQGAEFLGIEGAAPAAPFAQPVPHRVVAPSPLADGTSEITMPAGSGAPKFGPSYVVVVGTGVDTPLVATSRVGEGRVVWWAAPTPVTNAELSRADNLQLLLDLVGAPGEREVLWDEHYHGYTRSLWSYAVSTPLPWIGVQLAIMIAAVLVGRARRSGPVRARHVDARSSPLEFIDMLGELYRRRGAASAAVAAARTRLKRTVASTFGMPADSGDDLIARTIAVKTGADQKDLSDLLAASARAIVDPAMAPADAVTLARRLQHAAAVARGAAPSGGRR